MGDMFGREYEVEILDENKLTVFYITDLRCSFVVRNTITKATNTAEIKIYNMNTDNRKQIQTDAKYIILSAGYDGDGITEIFEGDVRLIDSTKEGTDWVTTITAGDGDEAKRKSRVNQSFRAGTPLKNAVSKIGQSFTGIDTADALAKLQGESNPAERQSLAFKLVSYLKGKTVVGKTEKAFDEAMRNLGKQWSVQKGSLKIFGPTDFIIGEQVDLGADSGLIGQIEPGEKGNVVAKSLLQGILEVGRKVLLPSIGFGDYRVEAVEHVGDTHGTDWTSTIEAKPL